MNSIIRISTRKSPLALKQAEMVKALFNEHKISTEFVLTDTSGDKTAHPLFSGKGIFIKELQEKLLNKTADVAVHSLKDLPLRQTSNLCIPALLPRASKEDVLIISPLVMHESGLDKLSLHEQNSLPFDELKSHLWKSNFFQKNHVGTSSLRRALVVKEYFGNSQKSQNIKILPLRGNVDSRLKKVRNNEYSCILLAKAGLERINLYSRESTDMFSLDPKIFVPSAGQGVIAIETFNPPKIKIFQKITHINTCIETGLERLILFLLGGDCHTPMGVHFNGESLFVISEQNKEFLRCKIPVSKSNLEYAKSLFHENENIYSSFFEDLCHSELVKTFSEHLIKNKFSLSFHK